MGPEIYENYYFHFPYSFSFVNSITPNKLIVGSKRILSKFSFVHTNENFDSILLQPKWSNNIILWLLVEIN